MIRFNQTFKILCILSLVLALSFGVLAQSKAEWTKAKAEYEKVKDSQTSDKILSAVAGLTAALFPEKNEEAAKMCCELLVTQFNDKGVIKSEGSVLQAIVELLSKTGNPKVQDMLLKKAKDKKTLDVIRSCYLESLGGMPSEAILAYLIECEAQKDAPLVRIGALNGIGRAGMPENCIDSAIAALSAEEWQVKLAAIEALGNSKSEKAIAAMVKAFKEENGRLRENYQAALKKMTGEDKGLNGAPWSKWWEEKTNPDAAKKAEEKGYKETSIEEPPLYFDEPILSKAIVFVIDVSGSMADPSGIVPKPAAVESGEVKKMPVLKDATPEQLKRLNEQKATNDALDVGKKITAVKKELINTILFMTEDTYFSIVYYSDGPYEWKATLVKATAANKIAAIDDVNGQSTKMATNIFDSMLMAFAMLPEQKVFGKDEKKPAEKKPTAKGATSVQKADLIGADTIYLLTDGMPNRGGITTGAGITGEITRMNLTRKVKVYTIGVGNDVDANFLTELATKNGGKYIKVGS